MKKALTKILITVLAVCFAVTGIGCGASSWSGKDVTLKTPGELLSLGGFVAETENYVYYINGVGVATENNTLGAPIKGALMAANKADIVNGAETVETCIVVPKLFVASDYKAGIYIYNGYVYYASPSTDKTASGATAYNELKFAKMKLDGTEGEKEFFSVESLSTEYRISKVGETVYITYYDSVNKELVNFNTTTEEKTVIAKTSVSVEKETLASYKFVETPALDDATVIYTVTVYSDEYDAVKAEKEGEKYTRSEEKFNRVYAYKAGDAKADGECYGVKVLDGKKEGALNNKYTISFVQGENVVYTVSDSTGISVNLNTFGCSVKDLYEGNGSLTLKNATEAIETNLIEEFTNAYVARGTNIVRTSLVEKTIDEEVVANATNLSTMLFRDGDFIYYIDNANYISRVKVQNRVNDEDKVVQRVSSQTVATDWFKPVIIAGKLFYVDNSSLGATYVYYVDVASGNNIKTEKDDGEITLCYLDGGVMLGKMTDADKVSVMEAKIEKVTESLVNGQIVFDKDEDGNVILDSNGNPTANIITETYAEYEALEGLKGSVKTETVTMLKRYKEALRLSVELYKLNDFDKLATTEKDALETTYNSIKAELEALKNSKEFDNKAVRALLAENLNWYYQTATKYFED